MIWCCIFRGYRKHCVLFVIAPIMNQGFVITLITFCTYQHHIPAVIIYVVLAEENITNILVLWLILRNNYNQYICVL